MGYARARWVVLCAAAALYAAGALAQSPPPTAALPPVASGRPARPKATASASAAGSATPPPTGATPPQAPTASARRAAPPLGPPPRPPPGYRPPPRYGYPYYPYYRYPYGYPPYPYSYAYRPPPALKPIYAKDAAARESPFGDVIAGAVLMDQRVGTPVAFGGQAGLFAGGRVRVAAKILFNVGTTQDENHQALDAGWSRIASPQPIFEWGGAIGYALLSKSNFVMSPGVGFLRTDRSAYGSFVGLSFPLEWVRPGGLRLGLEAEAGEAFGGTVRESCDGFSSTCISGQVRTLSRESGAGFYAHFEIGFGFHAPEPIAVKRQAGVRTH